MKKAILLLISLVLCSCQKQTIKEKVNYQSSIMVASDLHLLSNNLISENSSCKKEKMTSDGRVQEYDYSLVEALVNKANEEKPNCLVLTGDLTFNGEKDSHLELIKLLSKVNPTTKVLVIPGNHDVCNIEAKYFDENTTEKIDSVTGDEFRDLYQDFGYKNAISYDQKTLSYIYPIDQNNWTLLLDTTLCRYNYENLMNFIGGFLEESTLKWIEENLKIAKEKNIKVTSFTHHNLISHNSMFVNGYTLSNADDLLEIFSRYQVKLNFSGHLHIQNIKNKKVNKYQIYDIASQSLLDYGNRYGKLDIYENCYDYKTYKLNLFDGFEEYSFNTFYKKFYDRSLSLYKVSYPDNYQELLDFVSKINCYYFDGDYQKINQLKKENNSISKFVNSKKFDNKYFKEILNVENINQNQIEIYL